MKILIPVNPDKRKPAMFRPGGEIHNSVPVKVILKSKPIFNWFSLAYWNDKENQWNSSATIKTRWSVNSRNYQIIEWYEEIEIESLYPDEDFASKAAFTAFGNNYEKQFCYGEGISFLKGFINKMLRR